MGLRVHSFTFNPNMQNTWVQVHSNKRQKLQAIQVRSKHPKHPKSLPGPIPAQAGNTPGPHRQRPRNTPAKLLLLSCCCPCKAPATLRGNPIQSTRKFFPRRGKKKSFLRIKVTWESFPRRGKEKKFFTCLKVVSKSVDNSTFILVS